MNDKTPDVEGLPSEGDSTLAARYARLETDRRPVRDRAEECARLTIPSLMPPEGHSPHEVLPSPRQSIGARGVNTLAAKTLMALLPPNGAAFRLGIDDHALEDLAGDEAVRGQTEEKLNKIERTAKDDIQNSGYSAPVAEALRQLIVTGNVLLYLPDAGSVVVYTLDRYVVRRDYEGNFLEAIVKETLDVETLEHRHQVQILASQDNLPSAGNTTSKHEVDIYTQFVRDGDMIKRKQFYGEVELEGTHGQWRLEETPVIAARWNWISGEDYGRSYVEEYLGDLISAEGLQQSLLEGAAAASRVNPMVNPAGLTEAKDIEQAENLEVIMGRADDVHMLKADNMREMQTAREVLNDILARLQQAFLMTQSVQRDAERVTKFEVQAVIKELEEILGGTYSLLAEEFLKPFITRHIRRLQKAGRIEPILDPVEDNDKPSVKLRITAGAEAIGRGHDLQNLRAFMEIIVPTGPDEVKKRINMGELYRRVGTSLNIDMSGLVLDDQQVAANEKASTEEAQRQQMLQTLMDKGTGPVAGKLAEMAGQQVQPQQTPA